MSTTFTEFKKNDFTYRAGFITITAEEASNILERSKSFKNRKINKSNVKTYADYMNNKQWDMNGETIKFVKNEDGVDMLVDGQNRLSAQVKAGTDNVTYLAVWLKNAEEVATVDMGIKRSLENRIQMNGIETPSNIGPIIKQKNVLDSHNKGIGERNQNGGKNDKEQIADYINNKQEYDEILDKCKRYYKDSYRTLDIGITGGVYAYLLLTQHEQPETIDTFFENLVNSKPSDNSIYSKTMNKLMCKKQVKGAKRTDAYIYCWNSFLQNRRKNLDTKEDWFRKSA